MGLWRDVLHAGGTGGLNWHLHAYSSLQRWQPTLALIDGFLAQVTPGHKHLVLIGGSAGWMMPHRWLQQFTRIDAYDIDPFAPLLFQWRHGRALQRQGVMVQHHRSDALLQLPALLQQHPEACVWFDNVLGQHRYRIRDEERVERELAALKNTLRGRSWGSLHDWLSGPIDLQKTPPNVTTLVQKNILPQRIDHSFTQALLQAVGAHTAWSDHLTLGVLPADTPTQLMPWAFRENYWHWLQAGWVRG